MGRVPLATAWPGSGCVCESHEALPGHEASFVAAGNPTFGRPLRVQIEAAIAADGYFLTLVGTTSCRDGCLLSLMRLGAAGFQPSCCLVQA